MADSAFKLVLPAVQTSSVVFASPHSGREYPESFLRDSVLDELTIRSSEDAFVDLLAYSSSEFGSPLITAKKPRAYVDLNRSVEELDPALISDVRRVAHNPRIASGLGVIPRVVANGRSIYRGKISMEEAARRLESYWHPYHSELQALIDRTIDSFGEAILIDLHSMPREAVESVTKKGQICPEIVIGDRFGASADSNLVDRIETVFLNNGFKVSRNAPFAGAFTTQYYGRPSRGQHAIQIEIDRSLYLDEERVRPSGLFRSFQKKLTKVISEISDIGRKTMRVAAE